MKESESSGPDQQGVPEQGEFRPFPEKAVRERGWKEAGISQELGERAMQMEDAGRESFRRLQVLLIPREGGQASSIITGEDHERGMRTRDALFEALNNLGRAIGTMGSGDVERSHARMKQDLPELDFLMAKVEEFRADAEAEISKTKS